MSTEREISELVEENELLRKRLTSLSSSARIESETQEQIVDEFVKDWSVEQSFEQSLIMNYYLLVEEGKEVALKIKEIRPDLVARLEQHGNMIATPDGLLAKLQEIGTSTKLKSPKEIQNLLELIGKSEIYNMLLETKQGYNRITVKRK